MSQIQQRVRKSNIPGLPSVPSIGKLSESYITMTHFQNASSFSESFGDRRFESSLLGLFGL